MFKALDKNPNDAGIVIEMTGDVRRTRGRTSERTRGRTRGLRDRRTIPLDFFRGRQSLAPFASRVRCIIVMAGAAFLHSFAASADVQFLPIDVTTCPEKKIELCVQRVRETRFFSASFSLSLSFVREDQRPTYWIMIAGPGN